MVFERGHGDQVFPEQDFFVIPTQKFKPDPDVFRAPEPGYEKKAVSCLPTDVERLARSEAVDGWALRYTAVDESKPDHVRAIFGRPLRRSRIGTVTGPSEAAWTATPRPAKARFQLGRS